MKAKITYESGFISIIDDVKNVEMIKENNYLQVIIYNGKYANDFLLPLTSSDVNTIENLLHQALKINSRFEMFYITK
jgi:hypothetical protein